MSFFALVQLGHLLLLLLLLELVEARAQDLHRHRLVLVLRALVLTGDDDAGREVRQAHGGVGLVDVLAAGAARAVGVDAQVLVVDLDLDRPRRSRDSTKTEANDVWRRALASNGEMRTRRWTPASAFR